MRYTGDPACLQALLLYVRREATVLRRELESIAAELREDELARIEGTLAEIESKSTWLLFAFPDHAVN